MRPALELSPLGDSAVVARLGTEIDEATLERVRALAAAIEAARAPGIVEVVPAYATVTVVYDPVRFAGAGTRPLQTVCQLITWCAERGAEASAAGFAGQDGVSGGAGGAGGGGGKRGAAVVAGEPGAVHVLPVCYGGEFGPDLEMVAAHCGLSGAEVIALHSGASYRVYAIGFVPGFPYLGGLPAALGVPRRATPRIRVPAGSVGIGGAQTGVYPLATPGGWHLIGRTPVELFRPHEERPCRLGIGDRVQFQAISPEEFAAWR
jgi:inhibitor of KinA